MSQIWNNLKSLSKWRFLGVSLVPSWNKFLTNMLKSYSSDIQNFFYIFPLFNLKPTTHVYRCNSLSIFKLFSVFEVLWVNLLCPHRFESCQSCFYFLVDDWIGIAGRFSDDWMIMELFLISISILMHSLFPMIFELLDMHRAIHSKINMSFYCKFIVWSPDNRLWWWLCDHVMVSLFLMLYSYLFSTIFISFR